MRIHELGLAGALLLSTSALANQATWLDSVDINGDGVISYAEARSFEGPAFAQLDSNGDNLITQSEWSATSNEQFRLLDANNDGVLQRHEFHTAYVTYDYSQNKIVVQPSAAVVERQSYLVEPSAPIAGVGSPYPPDTYVLEQTPYGTVVTRNGEVVTQSATAAPATGYATTYHYQVANAAPEPTYHVVTSDANLAVGDLAQGNPFLLDTNKDALLSQAEVIAYNNGNFQRHDVDGNGWLSAWEWDLKAQEHFGHRVNPAVLGTLTNDTFTDHDLDSDGRVTKAEWDARIIAEFTQLDYDGDTMLERSEFELAGLY